MKNENGTQQIFVWDFILRLIHWLFFISFIGLFITGLFIHSPRVVHQGEPWNQFSMATTRNLHMLFAHIFAVVICLRLLWFFLGNQHARWYRLKFYSMDYWREIVYMGIKYATFRHVVEKPFYVGHNALAALVYAVIYICAIAIILTGYALKAGINPEGFMAALVGWINPLLGNEQATRNWHLSAAWLATALAVFHMIWAVAYNMHADPSAIKSIFVNGYQKRDKDWKPSKPWEKAEKAT